MSKVLEIKTVGLDSFELRQFGHDIQLGGLLFVANGRLLISPFPDESFNVDDVVEELSLTPDDWTNVLYQSDVLETELIGPKKAIVRKSQRQIDQNVSWAVFKRDGYRCRYCGRDDVPLSVDHVDLWEAGGASVAENLLSVCKSDNRRRGAMDYQSWIVSELYKRISRSVSNDVLALNLAVVSRLPELIAMRVSKQRSR